VKYYHGGAAGLRVGGSILPPTITGVRAAIDSVPEAEPLRQQGELVARRDRVYITADLDAARLFAALHPDGTAKRGGDVYEVEPLGEVEPDPDCLTPGYSWRCERARILRIVRTGIPRARYLAGDDADPG
jgi:hypothetical protein